ncbi:MAG: hypothetical protein V4550_17845 [Gemmatimonadota bacterium]
MIKHRVVLAAVLCAAAACTDDATPIASPITMVPTGDVQVVIQQDKSVVGEDAVFIVQVVANGLPVAAYQGDVTFSPEAMKVMSVRTAENKDGEFRVVNSEQLESGHIKFAVFAPEALGSTEAFRFVARLNGPLSAANVVGALDVVGEASGVSVSTSKIRKSVGIYDAHTNALIAR